MPRATMPWEVAAFFEQVARGVSEAVLERLMAFLTFLPHKVGGARAWRVECAALLTAVRARALQEDASGTLPHRACGGRTPQKLAFRFVQMAAMEFKPKSKTSWWPWVALACGVLGQQTADLGDALDRVCSKWVDQLLERFNLAVRKFGLERPPRESQVVFAAGAKASLKHPAPAPLAEAAYEIRRIVDLKAPSPWKVLGLQRGADTAVIRQRYRELALLLHPDKCGLPEATAAFRAVHEALMAATRGAPKF